MPGTYEYGMLHDKGKFKLQLELRLLISWLRWENFSGLSTSAQCNPKSPYKWKREAEEGEPERWCEKDSPQLCWD